MARKHAAAALAAMTALAMTACSSGADQGAQNDGEITGDITVLTQRTDIVDTTLADYAKEFEATYPGVHVEFEAITDYEGDVSIRLNTQDFGDVLLIPNSVSKDQLANFFEPLGSVEELEKTYRFVREQSFEGEGYGLAITGNAQGMAVNTRIWAEAGVTEPPTTPDELYQGLQAIKDTTDAIPYYTNYADGWPLSQWQGNRGTVAGPDTETLLAASQAPWVAGEEMYEIDSMLFEIVNRGLSEPDPTTTNWEESKDLLGSGEVATMVLGSWSVVQLQEAAEAMGASKDDIAYWPLPLQVDGTFHSVIGGDYKNAVSKYSKNKAAAKAWVEWFAAESGYAENEGGLTPTVGSPLPDTLSGFEPLGVELIEIAPAPAGEEGLLSEIYNTAEIDLWGNVYRQKLIDTARGAASGDKTSFFEDLNSRWAAAQSTATT